MSVKLMSKVFESDLPSGQKFVLLALCDHANDEGVCYPSQSKLAARCSLSERAVSKHLFWLEQRGIIHRERRERRKHQADLYQIFTGKIDDWRNSLPEESLPEESLPENSSPENSSPENFSTHYPKNFPFLPEKSSGFIYKEEPSGNHQLEPSVCVAREESHAPPSCEKTKPKKPTKHEDDLALLAEFNITGDLANDYLAHRKAKRATVSRTVLNALQTKAEEMGLSVEQAVVMQLENGWTGFEPEWVRNRLFGQHGHSGGQNGGNRKPSVKDVPKHTVGGAFLAKDLF